MIFIPPASPQRVPLEKENKSRESRKENLIDKLKASCAERSLDIRLETKQFTVKSIDSWNELQKSFQLRHQVFREEIASSYTVNGLDFDHIDLSADHIGIFENKNQRLVGSYRLVPAEPGRALYSEERFYLEHFLRTPGKKVELGRACVAKAYRGSVVIHLLWKGIGLYLRKTQSRYLFGCSSLHTENVSHVKKVFSKLRQSGKTSNAFNVKVFPHRRYSSIPMVESLNLALLDEVSIPPLFEMYLKLGARVCAPPARDTELKSADLFTVLDCVNMPEKYRAKYLKR